MNNHMSEALKQRRGKGIALHITIGPEDDKSSDLAPSGVKGGHEMSPMGKPMAPQMDGKEHAPMEGSPQEEAMESPAEEMAEMHPDHGMDQMDQDMSGAMSDHEKGHLMSKKPSSLGERARFEALHRMKGKK